MLYCKECRVIFSLELSANQTGFMQTPSLLEAARRGLVVFAFVYCVGLSFQKSKRHD